MQIQNKESWILIQLMHKSRLQRGDLSRLLELTRPKMNNIIDSMLANGSIREYTDISGRRSKLASLASILPIHYSPFVLN